MVTSEFVSAAIYAIRNDEKIGKGTCSLINEAWSDEELREDIHLLSRGNAPTVPGLIAHYRKASAQYVEWCREQDRNREPDREEDIN